MPREMMRDLWENHRGKITGALVGLVFAVLVITIGVLWTLFVGFCVIVGYHVGKRMDEEKENLLDILERYLPHGRG